MPKLCRKYDFVKLGHHLTFSHIFVVTALTKKGEGRLRLPTADDGRLCATSVHTTPEYNGGLRGLLSAPSGTGRIPSSGNMAGPICWQGGLRFCVGPQLPRPPGARRRYRRRGRSACAGPNRTAGTSSSSAWRWTPGPRRGPSPGATSHPG